MEERRQKNELRPMMKAESGRRYDERRISGRRKQRREICEDYVCMQRGFLSVCLRELTQ